MCEVSLKHFQISHGQNRILLYDKQKSYNTLCLVLLSCSLKLKKLEP